MSSHGGKQKNRWMKHTFAWWKRRNKPSKNFYNTQIHPWWQKTSPKLTSKHSCFRDCCHYKMGEKCSNQSMLQAKLGISKNRNNKTSQEGKRWPRCTCFSNSWIWPNFYRTKVKRILSLSFPTCVTSEICRVHCTVHTVIWCSNFFIVTTKYLKKIVI